jgi:hypothetical protein
MDGSGRSAAALVFGGGAAMPWAQQQGGGPAPPLMPASMTFGLPFLGGAGASRRRTAPFASVSASGAPPRLFAAPAVEPATGIAYPDTLCVLSKSHCPGLAGVG